MILAVSAIAAPQPGPLDDSFYTVPTPLPSGSHGDLIWYRDASAIIPEAPAYRAWNVLYLSTDAVETPNAVTGTVLVPQTGRNGRVISYAVGTHGLAPVCAPSKQLDMGLDYENANIAAALQAGYAVLITDNPGYTNGDVPSYMVGIAQGHACLDIITAAKQIPQVPIRADAQAAIWGYSQGGQTAAWAGQLQPGYMPDLDLVGVAAGGVPADLIDVGYNIDGKVGSAFLLQVVMGLWSQYPDAVPLETLANDKGKTAIAKAQEVCTFGALFEFMHQELSEYVVGNPPLSELIDDYVYQPLTDQKLGGAAIQAPVYLYHGTADEIIPLEQHLQLKETYCSMGVNTTFGVYPGDHIITQFQAAPYVLAWIEDRFDGVPTRGTCSTMNPRPEPDHNPLEGDFIVSLNQWPLNAMVHLKTLNQDVVMPEESTFSADTNMTQNEITGSLSIPVFTAPIRVVLPLKVEMSIEASQPMTGETSLDEDGQLYVNGVAYSTISISGIGLTRLTGIPINLHTEEPVAFPIRFDGPISSLGNGKLTFTGTTTFPPMTGGMFKALFSALMSGPGQTYEFTVAPPEPRQW
jgi:pimeloyl-ACP methyl ester carboxylesterase